MSKIRLLLRKLIKEEIRKMRKRRLSENAVQGSGTEDDPFIDSEGTHYFAEDQGGHFVVVAQQPGYPASEAYDSWFKNEKDAIDIARMLAAGEDPDADMHGY